MATPLKIEFSAPVDVEFNRRGSFTLLNVAGDQHCYPVTRIISIMAERLIKSLNHFFSPIKLAPGEKAKRLLFGLGTIVAGLSFFILGTISCALESDKHLYAQGMRKKQLRLEREKNKLIEAKKTAEAAIHAKKELLANMSHELRTALNHINGFTELIVDQKFGELNEIQAEYLNDALQSSKYLLALINDILDLKKMETGKPELKISEININTLLETSLTMIRERALDHGIQVSMKIDRVPETIKGDQRKLQQVMYNLLSNAAKFTPAGGSVTVSAQWVEKYFGRNSSRGGAEVLALNPKPEQTEAPAGKERRSCVEFVVADSGIGINPADLERIFNRFEQADGSSQKKFQGIGLGLSLSKRYVELHDGRIWAQSGGEGQGSCFRFLIPV